MAPSTPRSGAPKIIIKPRRGQPPAASTSRLAATPDDDPHMEDNHEDVDVEAGESSGTPLSTAQEEVEEESDPGEDDVEQDGERVEESVADDDGFQAEQDVDLGEDSSAKRSRGRPRGRPRGSVASLSRTPRGRGRGRGRGKGKGITIRLPKRGGEEWGEEVETPGEQGESAEGLQPVAGGKPFKRINGVVYIIDGDEYITKDDPKGDTKIDANGDLLGGRRFKAQTFTIPSRHPERKYMLAIDAARTSGFRDSLYYFRRNPLAMKLNASQAEKEYLIEAGKIGSHLRTRSVTLITARSAYKLHGAKMIADGRWVVDDYYEDKALEDTIAKGLKSGDSVGEVQDISTLAAEAAALANGPGASAAAKQERSGTLGMYRAGGPTTLFGGSGWGPYSDGPLNAVRKSLLTRDGVNEENWMFEAARRTVEASEDWAKLRRDALKACGGILGDVEPERHDYFEADLEGTGLATKRKREWDDGEYPMGVYEAHTGTVLYRADTQPTTARWEPAADDDERRVLGSTKVGSGAWGLAWVDTVLEVPKEDEMDVEGALARAPFMDLMSIPLP